MKRVFIPVLLLISLLMGSVGCSYQGRLSLRRVWADYNTLNAPALYYEKLDHFPYHAAKVDHFRWMYNKGPSPRVPYQEIPEWALDQQNVFVEDCETLPPMNAAPNPDARSRAQPQMMLPRVMPNRSSESDGSFVTEPPESTLPDEQRQPPAPAIPESGTGERLRQPVKSPLPQAGKKEFHPFLSRKQSIRPSMMSNRPVGL